MSLLSSPRTSATVKTRGRNPHVMTTFRETPIPRPWQEDSRGGPQGLLGPRGAYSRSLDRQGRRRPAKWSVFIGWNYFTARSGREPGAAESFSQPVVACAPHRRRPLGARRCQRTPPHLGTPSGPTRARTPCSSANAPPFSGFPHCENATSPPPSAFWALLCAAAPLLWPSYMPGHAAATGAPCHDRSRIYGRRRRAQSGETAARARSRRRRRPGFS